MTVATTSHADVLAHPLLLLLLLLVMFKMRSSVRAKAVLLHAAARTVSVAVTSSSSPSSGRFSAGTSARWAPKPRGISMVWMTLDTRRRFW